MYNQYNEIGTPTEKAFLCVCIPAYRRIILYLQCFIVLFYGYIAVISNCWNRNLWSMYKYIDLCQSKYMGFFKIYFKFCTNFTKNRNIYRNWKNGRMYFNVFLNSCSTVQCFVIGNLRHWVRVFLSVNGMRSGNVWGIFPSIRCFLMAQVVFSTIGN